MSTLELTALTLVSIWLAVLSIGVLITVRQVGILTVRLDMTRDQLEPVVDGLAVGASVPDDALAELPRFREGSGYILALSGTCNPCREFVAELDGHDLPRPVIALVAGAADRAEALISVLPPTIDVIRDPNARCTPSRAPDPYDALRRRDRGRDRLWLCAVNETS